MDRLNLYRRHSKACPGREKGQSWTGCTCPIWVTGELRGEPIRHSLRTCDWARHSLAIIGELDLSSRQQNGIVRLIFTEGRSNCAGRHVMPLPPIILPKVIRIAQ